MRTWSRAEAKETICGGPCAQRIKHGAPVQLIFVGERKTPLVRCEHCADEPVPADLPAVAPKLEKVRPIVSGHGMTRIDRLAATVPLDRKQLASGE